MADAKSQSQRFEGAMLLALTIRKETTSQETRWPLEGGKGKQMYTAPERAQPCRHLDLDLGPMILILDF